MKKQLFIISLALLVLAGCLAKPTPVVVVDPSTGQPKTNQVWSPTPVVGQITNGAATVAPLVPPPWNVALTALAGLFGTAVAGFVAFKNKQEANKQGGVNATIIEAVEGLGAAASTIKQAVTDTAVKNGNADAVHEAVQKNV
jgi:hypothetical protein